MGAAVERRRGRRGGGPGGGGSDPARRPRRRGSGAPPVSPAARSGCGRRAPRSAGRRRRGRAGSTTGRASSRRSPVDSATAVARPAVSPGGSRATRSVSARRARAARRRSRSATFAGGRAGVRARRQVDDEDVDRSGGEEHPGDRQALVERLRRQDDEPVEPDAAGGGLDRVEGPGEVQPGDDRAVGLGLGDEAEGERRGAGARRAAQGHAGAPRQPARPDDRVEGREAGPDDPLDAGSRLARGRGSEPIGSSGGSAGNGAVASAPITRGAAAPHRVWRDARAADTSGERLAIGRRD